MHFHKGDDLGWFHPLSEPDEPIVLPVLAKFRWGAVGQLSFEEADQNTENPIYESHPGGYTPEI